VTLAGRERRKLNNLANMLRMWADQIVLPTPVAMLQKQPVEMLNQKLLMQMMSR